MDPSDDIRKLEGHLELIENILAHAGGDDADGAQMVNEQFQACNELRPNLETAAEIVLDQDDGAALFSQITNLLERLENMEREWKTRKNSRPRVLSETSAPSASPGPAPPTGTQGSGMSPSPVSSEGRKEEKKGDFAFQAWPGESFEANPFPQSGFESATWGNWADSGGTSSAWPAEGASMSAFPQPAFDGDGYGGWPAAPAAPAGDFDTGGAVGAAGAGGSTASVTAGLGGLGTGSAPLGPSTPSPAASPAIRARDLGPGSSSALSTASVSSLQLHIKCSMSDIEEVQRDQDRFKQRFVRAAAKAAGVPEYRIRVKSITNI